MGLRFDLVFSYWIIVWYLIYMLRFITYSPKFVLGLGIIENLIMLICMFYFGSNKRTILYFVVINIFIKGLPFYTLIHDKITIKDINATFIIFLVYLLWLYINNESIIQYQKKIFESLIHNKDETPFLYLINRLEAYFKFIK